jgi:hypothetical protein
LLCTHMLRRLLIAIALIQLSIVGVMAQSVPASMGITPTTVPEVLQVLDNTKTWVTIGTVDPTAHAFLLGKAQGGTGTATPGLVAGPGISLTGSPWPNQTIGNTSLYASLPIPLPVLQGGTGTTAPSPVAGAGITISGAPWPNQIISLTNPVGTKITVVATIDKFNAANVANGGSGCPNGSQTFNVVGGTSSTVGTVTGTVTGGVLGGSLTVTAGNYSARPPNPVTITPAVGSCTTNPLAQIQWFGQNQPYTSSPGAKLVDFYLYGAGSGGGGGALQAVSTIVSGGSGGSAGGFCVLSAQVPAGGITSAAMVMAVGGSGGLPATANSTAGSASLSSGNMYSSIAIGGITYRAQGGGTSLGGQLGVNSASGGAAACASSTTPNATPPSTAGVAGFGVAGASGVAGLSNYGGTAGATPWSGASGGGGNQASLAGGTGTNAGGGGGTGGGITAANVTSNGGSGSPGGGQVNVGGVGGAGAGNNGSSSNSAVMDFWHLGGGGAAGGASSLTAGFNGGVGGSCGAGGGGGGSAQNGGTAGYGGDGGDGCIVYVEHF